MLDAAHSASEVLRVMFPAYTPASQELKRDRVALLAAVAGSVATDLSVAVADAIVQFARNCPYFSSCYDPAYAADGSNAVCEPVMTHVFKGSVIVPRYSPCNCYRTCLAGATNKAAIGASLKACLIPLVAVPNFHSLSVAEVHSAVSDPVFQAIKACGRDIVAAMPPNHTCGNITFTSDDDGHIRAAVHMIVCEKLKGSYDAACECVLSIGSITNANRSGTTVTADTKDRMDKWLKVPAGSRIPLITDATDLTGMDALLHLIESEKLYTILKPHPAACTLLPTVLRESAPTGAQAFVDKFSGASLIDREKQIAAAVVCLRPVVSGAAAPDSMHATLIWGPAGTGKSQSAEAALFRLNEFRTADCCMDKVNCRYPSSVASGLELLGRRMGKTLGVGPDTVADDVLKALRKHLATIPCVVFSCGWFPVIL